MIIENSVQFDVPHINVAKFNRTAAQHIKWKRRHDKAFSKDRAEYCYCLLTQMAKAGYVALEDIAAELHRLLPTLTYKDCETLVDGFMTPHASFHEWEESIFDVFLAY